MEEPAAALEFRLIALTCSSIFYSSESPTDSVSEIRASFSLLDAACKKIDRKEHPINISIKMNKKTMTYLLSGGKRCIVTV